MRSLTHAQAACLDRLADETDEAKVVGWLGSNDSGGPVIEYRGGYRYVNKWGRINATKKPRDLTTVNF